MSYTLIGTPDSRAFRVLWALEELALPYTLDPAAPRSDRVRAHAPDGRIPVLLDEGAVLTDSIAIMT